MARAPRLVPARRTSLAIHVSLLLAAPSAWAQAQDVNAATELDKVVVVGAMSHMCIDATVRAANDLGYRTVTIHDACATREQQFGGRTIHAADVHGAAMSALSFAYANVQSLDEWRSSQ